MASARTPKSEPADFDDEWMTAREIAEMLGVSRHTVHSYQARNRLPEPKNRAGRVPLWSRAEIMEWNANRPGLGWRAGATGYERADAADGTKKTPAKKAGGKSAPAKAASSGKAPAKKTAAKKATAKPRGTKAQ